MKSLVDVSQADRDMAARFVIEVNAGGLAAGHHEMYRKGLGDNAVLVQILARHRLTAEQAKDAEIGRLRDALTRSGRAAGAFLADDVSSEFLQFVPGEVEGKIAEFTALLREARNRLQFVGDHDLDLLIRIDTILNREGDNATG